MIGHIDVCLCICKITLRRSSLKINTNVIEIDTCITETHSNFHFLRHLPTAYIYCNVVLQYQKRYIAKHQNHHAVD